MTTFSSLKRIKLFKSRLDQVLKWFPLTLVANDVRLLTKRVGSERTETDIVKQFAECAADINRFSRYRFGTLSIQIRFTLEIKFPYLHDRFAIIDDELWHFGATVGGLHNLVNAASRGWDVDDHDAVRFFDNAWDGEEDISQEHGNRSRGRRGSRA